ncbi:Polynucleotide 5'-hydroxyl-kinase NOL9 [Tetrabaena socialis]|uniref:Polynucleotide 5'-hydroxyl-kinase NOL9 n=1 Tax=Tetrabaena socialis TaxID=47790 RepID=A0A2J8AI02_9CHLO|nr:Polynucleotide 5'-hydroxyl-kinase NOL9 [Tetrabaena socialis]|eukprot:PNH12131.1 Polynucleotide 5'-hydroxyl-kinase NOL9 [Tetrabaena socialis]
MGPDKRKRKSTGSQFAEPAKERRLEDSYPGDVSPEHDPQLYLAAVQALYGTYWAWAQSVAAGGGGWPPLVVNTHGWVKGLGFDLLTQLLRLVAPTHVIQVRGEPDRKNLPRGAFWCDPRDPQAASAPAEVVTVASVAPDTAGQQQQQQQQGGPDGGGNGWPAISGGAPAAGAWDREQGGRGRGGGGGGGGPPPCVIRSLKPVESRALAWHAWAKRVVGAEPEWGSYESDDFWRNAGSLASHPPYRVSLDALHVQLLAGSVAPHQLGRVLNGAVVGLLATHAPPRAPTAPAAAAAAGGGGGGGRARGQAATAAAAAAAAALPSMPISLSLAQSFAHAAAPAGAGRAAAWPSAADAEAVANATAAAAAAAAYPPGRISYAGATSSPPPLLPCVGLGIVRAVDMARREVLLLTDVAPELLECVGALVVGRLELPGSLLVGGEVASPYQQLFGLSAEATGAGSGRARKNLSRSSLVELAG